MFHDFHESTVLSLTVLPVCNICMMNKDMEPVIRRGSRLCCACPAERYMIPNLHFFRFPKNKKRCKIWVDNLGFDKLQEYDFGYLNEHFRLCNFHFEDSAFRDPHKNNLKYNAVPTLFGDKNGWGYPKGCPPAVSDLGNSTLQQQQQITSSSTHSPAPPVPVNPSVDQQQVSVSPDTIVPSVPQTSQQQTAAPLVSDPQLPQQIQADQPIPPGAHSVTPNSSFRRIAPKPSLHQCHFPSTGNVQPLNISPVILVKALSIAEYETFSSKIAEPDDSQSIAVNSVLNPPCISQATLKRASDGDICHIPSKINNSPQNAQNNMYTNTEEAIVDSDINISDNLISLPTFLEVKTEIFDENIENESPSTSLNYTNYISNNTLMNDSLSEKDKLLLYRKLCSTPLKLPSTLWTTVCHPKREFFIICQVGFVCGFTVDKGVRFTAKMSPLDIHIRNTKVRLPDHENVSSIEDVERLVCELDKVTLCPGTGLKDVGYSKVCNGTARMSDIGQLTSCNSCSMLKVVLS